MCYNEVEGYMENTNLQQMLEQKNYDAIMALERLSKDDIELILNFDFDYDNNTITKVIDLLRKKVLTAIKSNRYDKKLKSIQDLRISVNAIGGISRQYQGYEYKDDLIGLCYKRLAESYLVLGDIFNAKQFYASANEMGVDCGTALSVLEDNTRRLNTIVAICKKLNSSKEVAQYAYKLIDDKLQYLEQPLDEYEVTQKLKACLSVFLRNKYEKLDEVSPASELVTAIESILKGTFYLPFAVEIDDDRVRYSAVRQRLARSFKQGLNENSSFQMYHFTMGNFPYLVKDGNGVSQEFYDFICDYYHIDKTKYPPQAFIDMAEYFQFFAKWIRNPVCHGAVVQEMAFKHLLEETVLKEDSWLSKIVSMTNMEYVKGDGGNPKEWFDEFYDRLVEYRRANGGYANISLDPEIGSKVHQLRRAYKEKDRSELTQVMIKKLDSIGFVWEAEKIDWFNPLYEKILTYKASHNGFVGISMDSEIGKDVRSLRNAYKFKGDRKLTPEMVERLDAIDFVWEVQKVNNFSEFIEKLLRYKEIHGSFAGLTRDEELGTMVSAIRSAYKKQDKRKLTPEMIDQLNRIGFPFVADRSLVGKAIERNLNKTTKDNVKTNGNDDGFTI